MHDRLFEHQDTLDDEGLKQYATELDLDTDRFVQELSDHTYASRVREDFLSGARSGVNGAPTFFIDGVRYDGPWNREGLTAALRETI